MTARPEAPDAPPEQFKRIYQKSRKRLLEDAAREQGREDAVRGSFGAVNGHQLGRLTHYLQQPDGLDSLLKLRKHLERRKPHPLGDRFPEFLEAIARDTDGTLTLVQRKIPTVAFGKAVLPPDEGADELTRLRLLSLCGELARRRRAQPNRGQNNG